MGAGGLAAGAPGCIGIGIGIGLSIVIGISNRLVSIYIVVSIRPLQRSWHQRVVEEINYAVGWDLHI